MKFSSAQSHYNAFGMPVGETVGAIYVTDPQMTLESEAMSSCG